MKYLIVITSFALACGSSTDEEQTTETGSGGEETTTTVEPTAELAWSEMDRDQRLVFMQQTVMPEMQAMFAEFDGERYAELTCATCHGENMQEADFQMPNGLAPLVMDQIPGMFQSDHPMAQFMVQRVWPRMTELLGAQPYNPETQEGFGCLGCHATDEGG